jgi:hypothetical protein
LNNVFGRKYLMRNHAIKLALLALLVSTLFAQPADAKMGSVRVVFTKAALVAGGGVGRGVLSFDGRDHPFKVYGFSVGVSIGASITKLIGRVTYLHRLSDFQGTYEAVGFGGALVGGAGGVQLRNEKGVFITLHGVRVGLEFAANLSGIRIAFG